MNELREKGGSALNLVLGKKLVAVSFVLNYITFQFENFNLAALARPLLVQGKDELSAEMPGYRDALCNQIGKTVVSASERPEKLEVTLMDDIKIVVPLDAAYPAGPEMANLSGKGPIFTAWIRPDKRS